MESFYFIAIISLIASIVIIIVSRINSNDALFRCGFIRILGDFLSLWLLSQTEEPYDPLMVFLGIIVIYVIFSLALILYLKDKITFRKETVGKTNQKSYEAIQQKKLADTKGLEKLHIQLKQDVEDRKRGIEALKKSSKLVISSAYVEKEKDWAILGGIANGIAGPIAGASVALDAMVENEGIRQRNQANKQFFAQKSLEMSFAATKLENELQEAPALEELKKYFEISRSRDISTLFSKINFNITSISADKRTNSADIHVYWEHFDNNSCIDGSICAKLYSSYGSYVGCIYLPLPTFGTKKQSGVLVGTCSLTDNTEPSKAVLEPYDLWEILPK